MRYTTEPLVGLVAFARHTACGSRVERLMRRPCSRPEILLRLKRHIHHRTTTTTCATLVGAGEANHLPGMIVAVIKQVSMWMLSLPLFAC